MEYLTNQISIVYYLSLAIPSPSIRNTTTGNNNTIWSDQLPDYKSYLFVVTSDLNLGRLPV